MPPKTRPVDQPPSETSSEEEEHSSSEEEVKSSSEEEEKSSSEEEEKSSSEEEEEEQPPIEAPKSAPKKPSPSSPTPTPTPASETPAKRPAEAPVESGRKKSKVAEEDGDAEEKKAPGSASAAFTRIWSEEDEIAILDGMIQYKAQKGADPSSDMSSFHEFIKGNLRVDVSTRSQMYEKIRRLKKKFLNNIKKGDNPDFAKPHDYKTFELSKKIWGNGAVSNIKSPNGKSKMSAEVKKDTARKLFGVSKEEQKDKQIVTKESDAHDFESKYPMLVQSFNKDNMPNLSEGAIAMMKRNVSLIGSSKASELEEKWTNFLNEEAELFLKTADLMSEYVKLILVPMKK